jgi:hypothetical protein
MKDIGSSFAKNHAAMLVASLLALVLAAYLCLRVDEHRRVFDRAVKDALKTSEGYDQAFIDMVNKLEEELMMRASFGYAGRKDPMTGTTRIVAVAPARFAPVRGGRVGARAATAEAAEADDTQLAAEIDPVRLTAIIYDNTRKTYTAVVMDGERSYSVDVGDRLAGRQIVRITGEDITMETATDRFVYNINGGKSKTSK